MREKEKKSDGLVKIYIYKRYHYNILYIYRIYIEYICSIYM